ncbi:hypothetical protein DL93DRAFT_1420895 [Clavulina sp. PMI_390]|nr:hypothetical protein DL93DRAFT_1420895 [Clavulina sp. PMI_390]
MAMSLSHVSSRWRAVALGCSRLWSELYLTSPSQAPLLALFGHRSKTHGYNLSLEFELSSNDASVASGPALCSDETVEITTELAGQISSIQLRDFRALECTWISDAAWELLRPRFVMFGTSTTESDELPVQANRWLYKTQALHLSGVRIGAPVSPLFQLDTFQFSIGNGPMFWQTLRNAPMPALRGLMLASIIHLTIMQPPSTSPITLSHLETIEVQYCDSLPGAGLVTPNLRVLSIRLESIGRFGATEILRMVYRNPRLEVIKLSTHDPESLIRVLRSAPNSNANDSIVQSAPCLISLHLMVEDLDARYYPGGPKHEEMASQLRDTLEPYLAPSVSAVSQRPTDGCQLESLRIPNGLVGEFREWYESRVKDFRVTDGYVLDDD